VLSQVDPDRGLLSVIVDEELYALDHVASCSATLAPRSPGVEPALTPGIPRRTVILRALERLPVALD
jgi:hypothetical protein